MCLDLAEDRFCIFAENTYVTSRRVCTFRNLLKRAEVTSRRICTVHNLLKTVEVTSRRICTVRNLLKTAGDPEKDSYCM